MANKNDILKYKTGNKVKIDLNKVNKIFGECSFFIRNINHFIKKIDSDQYTHEVDEGVFTYLALDKFNINNKTKEKIIKQAFEKKGLDFSYDEIKQELKAEILVETEVETNEEGEVVDSTITTLTDPNTLDDVNKLENGVGDNNPKCDPKSEDKQFQDCDLEYGLEVFCYNASKIPWADWRLHFPLFRGLYSIFDNSRGVNYPPLTCSYLVNNDYAEGDCNKALEFPAEDDEEEGKKRDTLRDADLHYEFFVEEQEGCEDNEDIPCYIFQLGHSGNVDLYPVITDVIAVDEDRIDAACDADHRDYNGLFTEEDMSFIRYNRPSSYNNTNFVNLVRNQEIDPVYIPSSNGTRKEITKFQMPATVTHGTYSFIMTEENIIINQQIFLNLGNVESQTEPEIDPNVEFETESGATEENNGIPPNVILDLGKIFPMRVIAVTKEPLDITVEDIKNGDIPNIKNNLFRGIVNSIDGKGSINLRADHNSTIRKANGGSVGYSKYVEGYRFGTYFSESLASDDIIKKIIGNQEKYGSRKEATDSFYIDTDIIIDEYKFNSLNSNKIKIDSSAVVQSNDTYGGFEQLINPSIYLTAIVSNKNYYRQITQVHNRVENDRIKHFPKDNPVFTISPSGPAQLPMPDGNYSEIFKQYDYRSSSIISESFIFNLFCHEIEGVSLYEWRLSELANDAWLIWKRWFVTDPKKEAIFVAENPKVGPTASSSDFIGQQAGKDYGYGEGEPIFYTADSEGIKIILVDSDGFFTSKVLLARKDIWDQDWFDQYLKTTGRGSKKIENDLGFGEDKINETRELTKGLLFDVSYYVNNTLPDGVKIPYERCFAAAIMQCSKAAIPDEEKGNDDGSAGTVDEQVGQEDANPTVGIGIQPLDFINNPSINADAVQDIVAEETGVLWCEPDKSDEADGSDFIEGTEPKDKLLLKESLEILRDLFTDQEKAEEAGTVQAFINSIINQEKNQRPNDLSYSFFVSKIADFNTKDSISGYQRAAATREFSEDDKTNEKYGYMTNFKRNEEYKNIFGNSGNRQSLVTVPASGDIVYAYARDQDEADRTGEEVGTRDLPPGKYKISYYSGGYQYGCGDGRKASIHDPDTECDGVYVRFNSAAPCAENLFLAPGTREAYDNIGELEAEFFGSAGSEREILHLGGPITFQLVLKERAREDCDDGSGQGSVHCDGGFEEDSTCLKYCVRPVSDVEEDAVGPIITDQYDDLVSTTVKNYNEMPIIYEPGGMSENTRMYVETFAIPRYDSEHDAGGSSNANDYLHPQFNCLGLYPDHPIEYMQLIEVGDYNILGDISAASFTRGHDAILVTPEFNTGSMSYHIVNFEKHSAWSEFGKSKEDLADFINYTERVTTEGLAIENFASTEIEEKVKGRADQIQKWHYGFYNRGKIINTVDGAICVGKICARSVQGPSYNLVDEDEAYFYTDGEELRDSINGISNKDINGWVKDIAVIVAANSNYTVDHIGFTPFGRKSTDIISASDLPFLGRSKETIAASTTRYDDGVHLLSDIKFKNQTEAEVSQRVDIGYGRVYNGGELIASENFDPNSIVDVKYLRDSVFQKYKVRNTRNCTVTDEKNRVFVFYEQKGNISCAMGHNLNTPKEQWFNFEGLVRTLGGETATQPYVVASTNRRTFYLFFKLNNQFICQKTLTAANFVIKDAFKEYWPIPSFDDQTPEDFGLAQFEYEGRDLRKGVINVIAGGTPAPCSNQTFIEEEQKIREDADLDPRIRLAANCIRHENVEKEEYAAYKDRKGHLVIFFTTENRQFMNIMRSNNEGKNWLDIQRYMHMTHLPFIGKSEYEFECETGLATEACSPETYVKEEDVSAVCDTKLVERMELVFDKNKNIIYLIYTFNEGLYVRQFDAGNIERIPEVLPKSGIGEDLPNSETGGVGDIIKNHFNLNPNSDNKPVKITGKDLEDDLEKSLYTDLKSATNIPVNDKGNGVYQLARPGAHLTRDGILKIYYFDKDLILWSVPLLPGDLKAIPAAGDAVQEDQGFDFDTTED